MGFHKVYSLENQLFFAFLEQISVSFTHYRYLLKPSKESGLKRPGFGLPPEGLNGLPFWRQPAGVMECWSAGVMKGPFQVESWAFHFANTPILQYSSTPKQFAILTDKTIQR
jgi:hypothetical protein